MGSEEQTPKELPSSPAPSQFIAIEMNDVRDALGERDIEIILLKSQVRKKDDMIRSLLAERTHLQQTISFLQKRAKDGLPEVPSGV